MIIEWAGPKKIRATPLMKKRVSCRQDIGLLISSSTTVCNNITKSRKFGRRRHMGPMWAGPRRRESGGWGRAR